MTITRVNNRYFESQRSEYLKDLERINPFQRAVPCWHPDSFIHVTISYYNLD